MAPNNPLSSWGNEKTMNLNTLLLTNIQSSPYFKVQLFDLKTFHEVVDEIYYKVDHLEPWEKGSRKTAGQTGMCGGVRGVGAGGIVSSAYCLLFKLFTLKLTKKQVNNLITHADSPYIRGVGFMYIRYCQPPGDLWDWYEPYLDDEEELDVKAGGGHTMTIGEMLRQWLVKLEWYSTLFPRIPVPIQKDLDVKLRSRPSSYGFSGYGQQQPQQRETQREAPREAPREPQRIPNEEVSFGEAEKLSQSQRGQSGKVRDDVHSNGSYSRRSPRRSSPVRRRSPSRRSPYSRDDFSRDLERERDRQRREKDDDYKHRDKRRSRSRSRSRDRKRDKSKERYREEKDSYREKDYHREKEQKKKHKKSHKHNKERDSSRENERHRDKDSSKEKDKHRDRDRKYS